MQQAFETQSSNSCRLDAHEMQATDRPAAVQVQHRERLGLSLTPATVAQWQR